MIKSIENIRIIINPASGKRASILPILNESMKAAGIKWEASITHQAGDATRYAKAAVREGIDALAVYGGDGTLMEAASGLIGSKVPLVILPGGSANIMASELGIPSDLKEACLLIAQGSFEMRTIDVGQFGGRYFIVRISIGFEADVVKNAGRRIKNNFGNFAYFLAAAAALKKTKIVPYHLKIDGNKYNVHGLACLITNAGNTGLGNISFDKHIDAGDGLLDVLVLRKADMGLLKLMAVTLLKGQRPDNLELVRHWQGKDISIASKTKQTVQCDGEILEEMPLHIKVIPGAVRVLVPKKIALQ